MSMLSETRNWKNFLLGLAFFGMLFLSFSILVVVKKDTFHLFNHYYLAKLQSTYDLNKGSSITYLGIEIGEIMALHLIDQEIIAELKIYPSFAHLITQKSYLSITPPINLKGAIFGASMTLNRSKTQIKLPSNSFIPVNEPENEEQFASIMGKIQTQVSTLLGHMDSFLKSENVDNLSTLSSNIVETSNRVNESAKEFVAVTQHAKQGFSNWSQTGKTMNQILVRSDQDIAEILANIKQNTSQFDEVLIHAKDGVQKANHLIFALEETLVRVKEIVHEAHFTFQKMNNITNKVDNSWLFKDPLPEKIDPKLHFYNPTPSQ